MISLTKSDQSTMSMTATLYGSGHVEWTHHSLVEIVSLSSTSDPRFCACCGDRLRKLTRAKRKRRPKGYCTKQCERAHPVQQALTWETSESLPEPRTVTFVGLTPMSYP
jgi:hypothetical protein